MTLEGVLRIGELIEIVVQDEYTHDVVIKVGEVYRVFDTT